MRIGIVSDTHNNLRNVARIVELFNAAGVERIVLCGITPRPDQGSRQRRAIAKTALGAEDSVPWAYEPETPAALTRLAADGYQVAAVETSTEAVDLFEWAPAWPLCLVFGNERAGITQDLPHIKTPIRIPMLGQKRSLNVATAAGVVLYELLRRRLYPPT